MRHENPGGRYGDEPSPEDRFAGRLRWSGTEPEPRPVVPIHLTDANLEKRANVTKGIRAVLSGLGGSGERLSLIAADVFTERFIGGERPLLLGYARDAVAAKLVAEQGLEAANGNISLAVGLSDDEVAAIGVEHQKAAEEPETPSQGDPNGQPDPDFIPSLEACRVALNLLAQHDGIPARAYTWAKIMRSSNPSGPWQEVMWFLLSAFPME